MNWAQRISMEEIVDADGDGRRTLRMYSVGDRTRRWLGEGKLQPVPDGGHMADLEVTRVREDGLVFWFKDPPEVFVDSLRVPHRSWPYHGMRLVTEDGKRTLRANYPGSDYTIGVKGRKLTAADFPDADGDGRRCILIGDIAPGDTIETPSRVSLKRGADGRWRLDANCGLTLALPGAGRQRIPVEKVKDGVAFAAK